jgi:2-dehydro-3-deoxyglucarate aldolase
MKNLKESLKSGKGTLGSWIMAGNTFTTEMIASAGFDWLVVDMEHSCYSTKDMAELVQTIGLCGVVPLVRVGANDPLLIKRAMDAGAHGVIVPMVNSVDEAKRAVDAVYYPPQGTRGVGLGRAAQWGISFEAYKTWLKKNAVVIVQIEHVNAMTDLKNILSVKGVDASIIGPYDLSGSMGYPGEFERDEIKKMLSQYLKVSKSVGKQAGYHIVDPDTDVLRKRSKEGYKFIAFGTDALFLAKGLKH